MRELMFIKIKLHPTPHLTVDGFAELFVSAYDRFADYLGDGARIEYCSPEHRETLVEEVSVSAILEALETMRIPGYDSFYLASHYVKGRNKVEDVACGFFASSRRFRHSFGTRLHDEAVAAYGPGRMADWFVRACREFDCTYGYVKSGFSAQDTWHYNHDPDWGPSRLEWINWFGPEYRKVISQRALSELPFEPVESDSGQAMLLRLCERADDYCLRPVAKKEKKWRRLMGRDMFRRELVRGWQKELMLSGIMRDRRAKVTPYNISTTRLDR